MVKNFLVDNYFLDNYQLQLLNIDKNVIVIAGAGAGKTLTILGKISYLVQNNYALSEEIVVISFTNASVNDIKKRINFNVNVFTFHKLAISILEKAKVNYRIFSSNLLIYIIEEEVTTCEQEMQYIILKFLKINTSFKSFCSSSKFKSFCKLILTFINLWKTNSLSIKDIPFSKYTKLEKKILYFIFKIYKKYIIEKKSINAFDFDDLIIIATNCVKNISLNYKYIIIDEFQDTSFIRLNLIKEIQKITNAKVIVVGDDWQSIYHFSGCNLDIFLNFSSIFENSEILKLVNTYRNSQELINIASKFVCKNPLQIRKDLKSLKNNSMPFIFVPYINKKEKFKKIIDYLITISNDIMVLARNNKDILNYIDNDFNLNNNELIYKNHLISYYTVHKSKGLEAEYVIIINCNNETLGFPNQIEDNILLSKLYPKKEIPYAEERRLFYVAITRCKEKTYLLYDKDKPSQFIIELKKLTKKELHHIEYFKS